MSETKKPQRQGGLKGVDPKAAAFLKQAATNQAALTTKQKYDGGRVRVKMDLPEPLKASIEAEAKDLDTSESRLSAFLLAWALRAYRAGDAELTAALQDNKTWARSIRFKYDLEIPADWLPGKT